MSNLALRHPADNERRADTVMLESIHRHAAWQEFIRFCAELRFGEIERLSIQEGLPVMAEQVKRKVKFQK